MPLHDVQEFVFVSSLKQGHCAVTQPEIWLQLQQLSGLRGTMACVVGDGVDFAGVAVVDGRRGGKAVTSLVLTVLVDRVFLELGVGFDFAFVPFL